MLLIHPESVLALFCGMGRLWPRAEEGQQAGGEEPKRRTRGAERNVMEEGEMEEGGAGEGGGREDKNTAGRL